MPFWRRRLIYTGATVVIIAAYITFFNIIQQAILTAHRISRSLPPTTPTPRTHLPSVTGFSLEMQFRTAPTYSCPSVKIPHLTSIRRSNSVWQHPLDTDIYLLSAYFDDRLNVYGRSYPFIRIIAMYEGTSNTTFYCQIWNKKGEKVSITEANLLEIWFESWDQRPRTRSYRPYLVSCPVMHGMPKYVSVVPQPCAGATSLLEVRGREMFAVKKNFAVCVKGLDFHTDISQQFIEWMEMLRILGAEKVGLYVYHVHPRLAKVLQYYERLGMADVVPITLPGFQPNFPVERMKFLRRNVWQKRRNELVPYNDCFYRYAKRYRYIVPIDVDEMIVPVKHDNWTELVLHLQRTDPELLEKYASYSAQQVYFLSTSQTEEDLEKVKSAGIPQYFGPALRHIRRAADFAPPGHSVKSFMSSDKCLTVFNHYALDPLYPGMRRDTLLPRELVQLNHYKNECPVSAQKDCPMYLSRTQIDMDMWRYKDRLIIKVNEVLSQL
uniref:Glycosyltransferase family 92 protein n=1 Tax=Strigamia maritima TaxID=126957 RepID=T1JIY5_STRMM